MCEYPVAGVATHLILTPQYPFQEPLQNLLEVMDAFLLEMIHFSFT